ncbi:M14 family zinc carboxypeptidase [Dyadobacter aurulentus]|uniref:M14 family zinc carboxypeptidase n=1 Tax=Dyadobacter sp. UC 10 TaxID=2605428 RepID=UPI0011F3348F|nr:M14 family zinc carboxypeptidase [Dyadobacter sp. UC 10]KAA0989185.1 peptidase M14 [Dyadobacter sp. UC 10]
MTQSIIQLIVVLGSLILVPDGVDRKIQELQITADFPGGNIIVDSIQGSTVYLRPDLRDTDHDWFYWYYAVKSNRSDSIRFVFNKKDCLTIKGPAVSRDGGKSWNWLFEGTVSDNEFTAYIKAGEDVRFSMGMPYTQANFDAFMQPYRSHASVKIDTLCITPKGRATERLVIHPSRKKSIRRKILITARHHACEMMANYVMEGMVAAVLSDDPAMKALRESTEFWIIPFMDKDGVEDGDQGKYRAPRDHNRDYDGKSIYCSTAALREQVPAWGQNQLEVMMDLHCPWIKGPLNEVIYLVGSAKPAIEKQQRLFMDQVAAQNRGSLKFDMAQGIVAYGTAWNTSANTTQGMSSSQWGESIPGIRLASSFEFPYSVHNREPMTAEKLRLFGRDMAFALTEYLKRE